MSDLRGRNAPERMSLGSAGKIMGAAIVAIAICGIGPITAHWVEADKPGWRKV